MANFADMYGSLPANPTPMPDRVVPSNFNLWLKLLSDMIQKRVGWRYNPNDPNYDYRAAFNAGIEPHLYPGSSEMTGKPVGPFLGAGQMMPDRSIERGPYHWSSLYKGEAHPKRVINGIDTATGLPVSEGQ